MSSRLFVLNHFKFKPYFTFLKIYIRIKDEEWNIYRRFSHFYTLNEILKQKYPLINTVQFPKKKTVGNKVSQKFSKKSCDFIKKKF